MQKEMKEHAGKYHCLYEEFEPGERVVRYLRKETGEYQKYEGIIMGVDDESIDIYWDTIDNTYCPDAIKEDFTLLSHDEIYNGNDEYTPIKRKKEDYEGDT